MTITNKTNQPSNRKPEVFPEFPKANKREELENYSLDSLENTYFVEKNVKIKDSVFQQIIDDTSEEVYGNGNMALIIYCMLLRHINNAKSNLIYISIHKIAKAVNKDRKTIRRALYYLFGKQIISMVYIVPKQEWAITLLFE